MAYDRNINFTPSEKFKSAWSLAPKSQRLTVRNFETPIMYGDLASGIIFFYIMTILAVSFDIYLGFNVLAKSGVSFTVVIVIILADIFLAIVLFLYALKNKHKNVVYLKNMIFKLNLLNNIRRINEDDKSFKQRQTSNLLELNKYEKYLSNTNFIKYISYLIIIIIASWKIYTYMSVLPPSISIFSIVKGKIVIMMAILTAIFHMLATEKTIASLWFNHIKNKEIKNATDVEQIEDIQELPIEYVGEYKEAKYGNLELKINDKGKPVLLYKNIIRDDEINSIVNKQTDEKAKLGIAIKAKENQLF